MKFSGEKLKELREKRGWSVVYAAEKMNLNPSYLSQIENGIKNNPRESTIEKFTKVYMVDKNYFYFDEFDPITQNTLAFLPKDLQLFVADKENVPYIRLGYDLKNNNVPVQAVYSFLDVINAGKKAAK